MGSVAIHLLTPSVELMCCNLQTCTPHLLNICAAICNLHTPSVPPLCCNLQPCTLQMLNLSAANFNLAHDRCFCVQSLPPLYHRSTRVVAKSGGGEGAGGGPRGKLSLTSSETIDAKWQAPTAGTRHRKRGKRENNALWAQFSNAKDDYKSGTTE